MNTFIVVAIPTDVAEFVRRTGKDPRYGHAAHTDVAAEPAPCRHCLQLIQPGEPQILFTYDAFEGTENLPLPGPIYIHADACERYADARTFPPELRHSLRTLNAYAAGRRLLAAEYVDHATVDSALAALGSRSDVDYIHVRSTTAGCFTFRLVRKDVAATPS